jgi:chromosome segregation ATPase
MLVSLEDTNDPGETAKKIRKAAGGSNFPVIVMSSSRDHFQKFQAAKGAQDRPDGFIPLPSPLEDVVDWVERLVGLPAPPNGAPAASTSFMTGSRPKDERELRELRREVESLQEQIHFYQRQLDQLSVAGEKETREFDQVLKDLQDDVEKERRANQQMKEELALMKADLTRKDREMSEKEQTIANLRSDLTDDRQNLVGELEALRKTLNESKEQHKKAQNALREYYKTKVDKSAKRSTTISGMEAKLAELSKEVAEARHASAETAKSRDDALRARDDAVKGRDDAVKALEEARKEIDRIRKESAALRAELETERQRSKKAKETLAQLTKALE